MKMSQLDCVSKRIQVDLIEIYLSSRSRYRAVPVKQNFDKPVKQNPMVSLRMFDEVELSSDVDVEIWNDCDSSVEVFDTEYALSAEVVLSSSETEISSSETRTCKFCRCRKATANEYTFDEDEFVNSEDGVLE